MAADFAPVVDFVKKTTYPTTSTAKPAQPQRPVRPASIPKPTTTPGGRKAGPDAMMIARMLRNSAKARM